MLRARLPLGRARALELVLQLRHLERRQELTRLDAVADVHADRVHVSGDLGVDHHILEGRELALKDHGIGQAHPRGLHDRDRVGLRLLRAAAAAGEHEDRRA